MKICVYAISKNESKFVDRWFESMKEADEIFVLDTGSIDDTVERLKKKGVNVKQEIINPFRFDVARNKSLEMVALDADICVCTDLDEVFESGWRKILEEKFKNANRCQYNYIWSFDQYGNPAVNFRQEKIHTRKGYVWVNPVHEVLRCDLATEKVIILDDITLKHYPDLNKSRSNYLPLLELAVKENPKNDRNMHYLGREYMYYGEHEKAIKILKKHLKMKNATWRDERCASMRFISKSYFATKNYDDALYYALMSISEAPYLRESYYEVGFLYYKLKRYSYAYHYLKMALEIKNNSKTYINDPDCYNGTIEDLIGVCLFYLNDYKNALEWSKKALEISPKNERIINNVRIIESYIE